MTHQGQAPDEQGENLSPEIYRELGKNGWRVPETEPEVKAAEEWVGKAPDRLPARLESLPDKDSDQERGGLLDRYLRNDRGDRSGDDPKAKDDERSNRDFDRE